MIKILLVDDHVIFTEGVAALLSKEKDFEIVNQCQSINATKSVLETKEIDVVMLDINLGNDNGYELCKFISSTYPKIGILCCSMYSDEKLIIKMMKNGASGYILKNFRSKEIVTAIRVIYKGDIYQNQEVLEILWSGIANHRNNQRLGSALHLTRREHEIINLIYQGKTTKEISEVLSIGIKTIEATRSNIFIKFEVNNMAGLIKKAIELNVLN